MTTGRRGSGEPLLAPVMTNAPPPQLYKRPQWQIRESGRNSTLRDLFAIPSVAMTVGVTAFAGLFSTIPILILYAMWFPRVFYKRCFRLGPSRDALAPLLLASYSVASVVWSDYPEITARASLEFFSMIVCVIVIARIVSTEAFIKGLILGCCCVLIATLIDGSYGRDYFTGEYTLVGMFGSKNQVGLYAEIGLYAAILYLFRRISITEKIVYAVVPIVVCGACLVISRSATSVASLAIVFAAIGAAWWAARFHPRLRWPVFMTIVLIAIVIGVAGFYLNEQGVLFAMLGKNATFTGRTYLWAEGWKVALKAPVFGHGYNAFWVQGQPQAERYWYEFQMFRRGGFHFHSMFIELFVELGIVGLLLICYIILANCLQSLRRLFARGVTVEALFSFGISVMFLTRAFVEVDFLGPFTVGCLLFYSILPHLAAKAAADAEYVRKEAARTNQPKWPALRGVSNQA